MRAKALLAVTLLAWSISAKAGSEDLTHLFKTGEAIHSRVTAGADEKSFWFTTQELYVVALHVDEEAARKVLAPFRGQDLAAIQKNAKVYATIAAAPFLKVIVLKPMRDVAAKDVTADFNDRLGKTIRLSSRELTSFVRCFRRDLREGEEVIIRIANGTTVSTTLAGESCPEVDGQKFARALLGVWFSEDRLTELLADAGPLVGLSAAPRPTAAAAPPAPTESETESPARKRARSHNERGVDLTHKGRFGEAQREFEQAVRIDPEYPTGHANLGSALGSQGKWDEAMVEFQEAIMLDPEDGQTYYNLGTALLEAARVDEAIPELQEAARLDPLDAKIHNNLGYAYIIKDRHEEAALEFEQQLKLDPKSIEGHFNLGRARHMNGDIDGGITEYREALRLNPRHANAHYYLGKALESKGLRKEAEAAMREALRLDPKLAARKADNN